MRKLVTFTILVILVIITIILFSYFISRQYYYDSMYNYPLPKCYDDWKCQSNGVEINMSELNTFGPNSPVMACRSITEDNLTSFSYTSPIPGVGTVIGNPSREFNTWSGDTIGFPRCASDPTQCPCYKVGDVYWKACPGSTSSSYYNQDRTFYDGVCGNDIEEEVS